MFAGNIGEAQSFETILTAADKLKEHPEIHWIVLGSGRQAQWVKEQVVVRGLAHCFHMMGHHPIECMPAWFAQADVMLVSLRADPIFAFTVPAKMQSYLACAKPIIATLDGEGARVVEDAGAGLGVAAEDAGALAEAVLKLRSLSDAERLALGNSGFRYFNNHFNREFLIDRLEGWFVEAEKEKM
jgi:glycosyltransferase involved in cell wall biosynthesis